MDDIDRQSGEARLSDASPDAGPDAGVHPTPDRDDSLTGEIAALIDGARTYAQAEIGFQTTRAKLTGRNLGTVLICVILALILVHIALLALAVGLVIALAPLVSIWGAIAIVVGGLLALVVVLGLIANARVQRLSAMFAPDKDEAEG